MSKHQVIGMPLSALTTTELVLYLERIADELGDRTVSQFKRDDIIDDDGNDLQPCVALQQVGYRLYNIGKTVEDVITPHHPSGDAPKKMS